MSTLKSLLACTGTVLLLAATANVASADDHTYRCVFERGYGDASGDLTPQTTLVVYDTANEVAHIQDVATNRFNGMPAIAHIDENSSQKMVLTWKVANVDALTGHADYRLAYFKDDGKYTSTMRVRSGDDSFDEFTSFGRCTEQLSN